MRIFDPRDPRLGQVFTPSSVADLTLALALDGLGPRAAVRLLDPACGEGIFLTRAITAGLDPGHVDGIDIDPRAAAQARSTSAARIVRADFLDFPRPARPFDVVAGNPPYVRQELLGAAGKARIAARLLADWPDLDPRGAGRADLALAFIARALRFVRPGGRVAFVLSAAVFDAGYGDALHAFLDSRAHLVALVASPRERWFPAAAVHAVIAIFERDHAPHGAAPDTTRTPSPLTPSAARLRIPVSQASARVHGFADLAAVADVRPGPPDDRSWGPLLRAPDAWFEALRDAGDWLVPLADLAEIRRGLTSGANEFFYLDRTDAEASQIEPHFLVPLFKSPRQSRAIRVSADDLPRLAFVCPDALADLPSGAREHIRRHAALAERPSLAVRPRWWSLPARPARLFLTKAYSARFGQHLADRPVVADQRVYALEPRAGVPLDLLAAALNATLTALAIESLGRASMGEGALELAVSDAARLPILDVRRLAHADRAAVLAAFRPLAARPLGDVFTEADRADRQALDAALLAATPLAGRRAALASALVATVEERLTRTNTLK